MSLLLASHLITRLIYLLFREAAKAFWTPERPQQGFGYFNSKCAVSEIISTASSMPSSQRLRYYLISLNQTHCHQGQLPFYAN